MYRSYLLKTPNDYNRDVMYKISTKYQKALCILLKDSDCTIGDMDSHMSMKFSLLDLKK